MTVQLTPEMIAEITAQVVAQFVAATETPEPAKAEVTPEVAPEPAPQSDVTVLWATEPEVRAAPAPKPAPPKQTQPAPQPAAPKAVRPTPQPAAPHKAQAADTSAEKALVDASPFAFTSGRVVLTPPVMLGLAEFVGEPTIVATGRNYPAAVLIFGDTGSPALQNLQRA